MTETSPTLSVVIPLYRSADCIEHVVTELAASGLSYALESL